MCPKYKKSAIFLSQEEEISEILYSLLSNGVQFSERAQEDSYILILVPTEGKSIQVLMPR